MKVLHCIGTLGFGGAEKLLVDSLPIYSTMGVQADLFVLKNEETPFYQTLCNRFKGKIIFSNISNVYSPKQIFELSKIIRSYDIVHVHLFPALYWVAIAKKIYNITIPIVFTEHSTNNRRRKFSIFRIIDRWIYKSYSIITAITPAVKEELIRELKIKDNKISVVYNGILLDKYQHVEGNRSIFNFADNSIILIQVSRFSNQKDQKTLINAINNLPERYKLLLVGDGINKEDCRKHVETNGLNERVIFLGNRIDIPELVKSSDIVIQSSNWEGFGLTAIEGMAAGKPVIASDVPGLSDIVEGSGLLFEKGNVKDLVEKILSLEDGDLRKNIEEKCYERSLQFSIDKMVKKFIEIYNEIFIEKK